MSTEALMPAKVQNLLALGLSGSGAGCGPWDFGSTFGLGCVFEARRFSKFWVGVYFV